ncbi:MAG TPA: hypothetical protein VGK17_15740 [Propionicimonas sp.]
MSEAPSEHWHWFQFQTYVGKTAATSRWTKAHLFRADEAGHPFGEPPCAPFQNWRDPNAAGPRATRFAPAGSPTCRGCQFVAEHAREEHDGVLGDVAFGRGFILAPRAAASPDRAAAPRGRDPQLRRG